MRVHQATSTGLAPVNPSGLFCRETRVDGFDVPVEPVVKRNR